MTLEMMIVLAVLVVVILLFIFEWVRVDVVGIIMMVALPLLGVITPKQAISGLSSNAVVSIIAVIIIGAGLDKTGVMNILARHIIKVAGRSETRIMIVISSTVGLISSFMQNIGAAALFMPAATRISKQLGVPISRILMPMGYCAIIGGCITLIGSSPLILLNDLMTVGGVEYEKFGLFSVTPIGIALLVAGLLYFAFFGRFVLPSSKGESKIKFMSDSICPTYGEDFDKIFEMTVPLDAKSVPMQELGLRREFRASVVGLFRDGGKVKHFAPHREMSIEPGDVLAVASCECVIDKIASAKGWKLKDDLDMFAEDYSPNNAGVIEAIITPRSALVGKTLLEIMFRRKYNVNVLALYKEGKLILQDLSNQTLRNGDALLLHGRWEKFHTMKETPDFTFTEEIKGEIMRPEKAKIAVGCLILALTLIMVFKVQLSIALLSGALGMILMKVMSVDEAYESVDWMTVFLLAGLIPLGIAFETTGTAALIADTIMGMLGDVSPVGLIVVIGLLTSFFTLVASNVGATVLLVPLAMNMALQAGADPRIAALAVAVAASNTFVLPTHQVNALIMRPGGYRTLDYVKAGAGMTLIYMVVMVGMFYAFYGL